jgi:uncharacterized OB-fold protein
MTLEGPTPTDPEPAPAAPAAAVAPVAPTITELNRAFWEGCVAGELRLQRCRPCGHLRYPISEICPRCLSPDYDWQAMSGRGEIVSWVIFQRGYQEAWTPLVPYNVVLVQLDEGPRMFGNVEPIARTDLAVGAPVRAVFLPAPDGTAIPRWRLVDANEPPGEDASHRESATAVSP